MIDRSLVDKKIHDSVMETCFESIVSRAFIGALPIDRSQLSAGLTQGFESYVSDCLKDLGGVQLLRRAMESEQDPTKALYLRRIWEVCNESANSVVDRVVEENKDDEALKDAADKVTLTDEEMARFQKKSDNLVPDELVRIIQQKTLDTIKEEKAAYQKDADLEAELANALNVAEDDESSEPDAPGDEDGNPVGGEDEKAPQAMTQEENGAKKGEQIGTDASESWGAATEGFFARLKERKAQKAQMKAIESAKAEYFAKEYLPKLRTVAAKIAADARKVVAQHHGIPEYKRYYDEIIGIHPDDITAVVDCGFDGWPSDMFDSDEQEIQVEQAIVKDFKALAEKYKDAAKFGHPKAYVRFGDYGENWRIEIDIDNADIQLPDGYLKATESENALPGYTEAKAPETGCSHDFVQDQNDAQKQEDEALDEKKADPKKDSIKALEGESAETQSGDTKHFNAVNNDEASGVCKIDTRENITNVADERMKDDVMLDAEKQNDAEAKKEVGEGGKVFESWGAFLDAYENEAAQEGFYHNIRKTDEYGSYKQARRDYRQAKRMVKLGNYDEAYTLLGQCIDTTKAVIKKSDEVKDTGVLGQALVAMAQWQAGYVEISMNGNSATKNDMLRIFYQFINKCQSLQQKCKTKKAKAEDFESKKAASASESWIDQIDDDATWNSAIESHVAKLEAAQEGIIKAIIHGRGAKKVTQAQLEVVKDVPILKLLDLYNYSIEFDGLKYNLDSSCDEFERGIKMMQAIGVKCHIESKEPYGVAFVDETYTIPNDPAILAMFGFDAEYQYGIFAEAGDRIEAGRLWIATKRGRKYDGMLLTTQEEIRQTAAYLIDLSKRGKLKKPLPKIEGFEIAYESAAAVNDEGFQTEPDPKEAQDTQSGCTAAFIKDQNTATKEDQKCAPTGGQIGQECPCEEKPTPKSGSTKAMETYMHLIAGPNPRPNHATMFSKIQELAYEGICATRETYDGIPFETMTAITKENTFPAFESNLHRGPRQRIDNVARYAFESLATPDEPVVQQENLETSLLTASVIYTFFETLSTMNLYSPKLADIRKFVDESLPLEQKTLGDKRLLEDAIRSVINDIKTKSAHARTVPEVDEARNDLQIVRERVAMPGFEGVRAKAEEMIKSAQESIDAKNDRLVAAMRPVQAAVESSTATMLRTRDTLKFDRAANLMGRKPNVIEMKLKIDPQGKSKYVALEGYTADHKPAGTMTVVLEGATESLVDYVTGALKASKLTQLDKHVVLSDARNSKIYFDNAN